MKPMKKAYIKPMSEATKLNVEAIMDNNGFGGIGSRTVAPEDVDAKAFDGSFYDDPWESWADWNNNNENIWDYNEQM